MKKHQIVLEPETTPMGHFQKERTEAISEMFNGVDEFGIYPTSKFFARIDDCVRKLLNATDSKSEYSPAESQMIICITRGKECTPERCLKCGWLRDEVRDSLNESQAEWEALANPK